MSFVKDKISIQNSLLLFFHLILANTDIFNKICQKTNVNTKSIVHYFHHLDILKGFCKGFCSALFCSVYSIGEVDFLSDSTIFQLRNLLTLFTTNRSTIICQLFPPLSSDFILTLIEFYKTLIRPFWKRWPSDWRSFWMLLLKR